MTLHSTVKQLTVDFTKAYAAPFVHPFGCCSDNSSAHCQTMLVHPLKHKNETKEKNKKKLSK